MIRNIVGSVFYLIAALLLVFVLQTYWLYSDDIANRIIPTLPVILVLVLDFFLARYLMSGKPWKFGKLLPLLLALVLSLTMLSYEFGVFYADYQLKGRDFANSYNDC